MLQNTGVVIVFPSLLAKLLSPGDSEGTFRSSSLAATCLPLALSFFIAEDQAEKLGLYTSFYGLTRQGIEPESTVSGADAYPFDQ